MHQNLSVLSCSSCQLSLTGEKEWLEYKRPF
jgi:hypothetical protein